MPLRHQKRGKGVAKEKDCTYEYTTHPSEREVRRRAGKNIPPFLEERKEGKIRGKKEKKTELSISPLRSPVEEEKGKRKKTNFIPSFIPN